jgi:hypothetical protein
VEPLGLPARAALVGLTPVTFKYRINDERHVGSSPRTFTARLAAIEAGRR